MPNQMSVAYGDMYQNLAPRYSSIITIPSGAAPILTPNLSDRFFFNLTSNIAVTFGVPTGAPLAGLGQIILLEVANGSGGALTTQPAYNAIFVLNGALPAIAAGQRYMLAFAYSQNATKWVQISPAAVAY